MTSILLFFLYLISSSGYTSYNTLHPHNVNHRIALALDRNADKNKEIMDSSEQIITTNPSRNFDVESAIRELKSLSLPKQFKTFNYEENRKFESIIKILESKFSPILTTQFLIFALGGEWNLLYSNAITKNEYNNLEFNITQKVIPTKFDSINGSLVNKIAWRLKCSTDIIDTGDLIVKSNYTVTPNGKLEVTLDEHILLPLIVPDDVEALVSLIQRSVPIEIFDPDGTTFYDTYLSPELRITRIIGSTWSKVNVFVK